MAPLSSTTTAAQLSKRECFTSIFQNLSRLALKLPFRHVGQAGAGLVDALKVVSFNTSISPATINLNDTDHFNGQHTITITNSGPGPVTYSIGHESGPASMTMNPVNWVGQDPILKTEFGQAIANFSVSELTVPAGGKASFDVVFTAPTDIDASLLPIYGGFVHIIGDNGEVLKATYLGKHEYRLRISKTSSVLHITWLTLLQVCMGHYIMRRHGNSSVACPCILVPVVTVTPLKMAVSLT